MCGVLASAGRPFGGLLIIITIILLLLILLLWGGGKARCCPLQDEPVLKARCRTGQVKASSDLRAGEGSCASGLLYLCHYRGR